MKQVAAACVLMLGLLSCALLQAQPVKFPPHEAGRILIKPRLGASNLLLQAMHSTHGAAIARVFDRVGNIQLLRLSKSMTVEQAVMLYRANPLIEYAEPDYRFTINQTQTFPNDPSFNQLWGLHNTGQSGGFSDADIDAPEAWTIRTNANTVVVGVIDSGIDYTHPDLAANMWTNSGEIRNNGIDDDNNGYIDDVYGINAITNSGNPMDDNDHGTHVAGTIGAVGNNGVGVAGVAWNVKLMALKFLSSNGSGSSADAIECINYSLAKGAHILNNSWGGGGFSQSLFNAINSAKEQGVIFVAAAGNDGSDNDQAVDYPSGYNLPNVVAVAATDRRDLLASYSNYGYRTVDLGAPGSSILSTTPNNRYSTFDGTSMATPQVSGALALLKAHFPSLSYADLIRRLYLATDPIPALEQTTFTGGRLNLYRALTSAQRPIPHLTLSTRSGASPLTVTFTDGSLGNLTSRLLNVGAGGSAIALNGSTTHTYTSSGTYTATLTVSGPDGTASRSQVIRVIQVQPPYAVSNDTYRWVDTTGLTAISLSDDGVSSSITLPFSFPYYGNQYTTAFISANGFLTLGSSAGPSHFENTTLPSASGPNNALYAFWDDLNPGAAGTIRYGTVAGNFVVSWEGVPHYLDNTASFSFQIVINRWGGIQYNYQQVQPSHPGLGGGLSATVGIEDDSGTMATLSSFNSNAVANSSARRFTRGAISINPSSANAAAGGGTGNITVTPAEPSFSAWSVSGQPAWLTVDVSANPHVWVAAANPGATPRTATLNIGGQTFTITQVGSPGSVTLNPTSASVSAVGGSGSITVTSTPTSYTSWTVTGQPDWLSATKSTNVVNWSAQANNSVTARSATLIIGDKSFTLNQSGATGSVTLGAATGSAPGPGGTGSVSVTPSPADFIAWTVTGQPAWLTATKSTSAVNWTAQANNSINVRSATLAIGDKTYTVNQSGATGTVTLGGASGSAPAAGGSGTVTVTPSPADYTTWTVSAPPAWLTTTRTGSGVSWTAQVNNSVTSRSHTLTIGDKSFTITQNGAVGAVTLSAASASAPAAGGSGSVTVTPSPADFTTWTVSAPPAWLSATRTATAVSWTAQANNSVSARAATLTIGDKTYTVNQSGATGSVTLTPATATVPSSGGAASITVIPTPADYNSWTVSATPSWLTVSSSGNTVSWNVAANNSVNARSANVIIGDKTFTLNQSGATGSLTLSASSVSLPSTGGSGSVTATPNPTDYNTWTVTGQPSWLTVTQSANVVSWSAPAINSVNARTATLAIGNQSYTVTQTGAVGAVALSASSAAVAHTGGTGSFSVNPTPADFNSWSIAGAPAWLTFTTSGNTVNWTVAAINSVTPRTATLTISNQTFTVTQSGAPGSITLGTSTATVGSIGGSGSVVITPAPADYTGWTVSGAPSWLIVSTSGSSLSWTAAANNSVSPRTATLAIDNRTFTISQLGATGSVSISPASASSPAAGITGTITVTPTPADYKTWTVSGQPAWLTIATTENTITWIAAANNSVSPRSATLTIGDNSLIPIGGQTFTLTQAGIPAYSVSTSSASITAVSGRTGNVPVSVSILGTTGLACTATSGLAAVQLSAATFTLPYQLTMTLNAAQLSLGSYSTNVTLSCPGAATPSATIGVAMVVTAPAPAQISLSQSNLSVTLKAGNNALIQPVAVSNPGGGAYQFTVTASTQNGGNWLSAVLIKDSVSFASAGQMQITLNPTGLAAGSYLGSVTVQAPAATEPTKTIPVTLTVAPADKGVISLAQSALNFTAVAGTTSLAQEIGVLNAGSGIMNWSATGRTLSGGNWLTVTPATGTSDAGQVLVPTISVRTSTVGLTAGEYVGVVEVAAANTTNLSELVTVRLTVLPVGTPAEPSATPTGLIFIGTAGQNDAGLQTVKLWNEEANSIAYQSGLLGGDNWLTTSPASGTVPGGSAATGPGSANLVLQSNFTSLPVGINRAVMTVFFPASGVARTVRVTSIGRATASSDPGAGPTPSSSALAETLGKAGLRAATCAPSSLIAVLRNLSSGFSVRAGVGQPVEALIYDSCGNAVTAGTVTLQASHELNGISLVSLKDGRWSGTWTPAAVSGATATSVQLVIASGSLTGALDSPVTGTVQPGVNCVFSFTSANPAAVAVGGGTGSVLVSATNGSCVRTAVSNASWLRVTSGDLAVGSGSVAFTADANAGTTTRTGVLTVGGQTFTVNQAGTPTFAISKTTDAAPMGGGTGRTVTVTATPGFAWTATTTATWITITGGASGSGNGTVTYTVQANTGTGSRSGVITVGGQTVTVTQSGPTPIVTGPIAGSGTSNIFTFTFNHPEGFARLGVVNVLINRALDGGRACYLAYSQPHQLLFLVDDNGPDAGLSVLSLGGSGSVSNTQCTVNASGSSATTSGNTLTLRLNMEFKTAFAGNRVIYLAAREDGAGGANSGWLTQGAWNVPGAPVTYPRSAGMSPATGMSSNAVISYTFDDQTSANNLQTVWSLINTAVDAGQACYVAYYVPGNLLFLYPDNGNGAEATFINLSGTNTIENSQCRISAAGSSVIRSGQRLTLNLNTTFKSSFSGPRGVWTAAQPLVGTPSAWTVLGNWLVP